MTGKRVLLAVAVASLAGSVYAFDPLLFVKEVKGRATITLPKSDEARTLTDHRAYLYGSRIETGAASEVRVAISERNFIVLGADTVAILKVADDDTANHRVVQVERGTATAQLEDDFDKKGTKRVTLQTLAGIGEPVSGGDYTVTVTQDEDLSVAEYVASRGEMKLYDNALFSIPALRHDYRVAVATSSDKGFVRVRDLKGRFLVDLAHLQNADGTPKTVEMQPEMMLKMWRKQSDIGGVWAVTVLFVDAKGGLVESLSYNVKPM